MNPNITKMNAILNHFRVISVESFRILPQSELRDLEGVYFQDRMIFLSGVLELLTPGLTVGKRGYKYEYLVRKYAHLYNIPTKTIIIDGRIHIGTYQY